MSAKDGVQPGTERVFHWVQELGLPCLVLLTKVDDENAKVEETVRR